MKSGTQTAIALACGYLLGRRRKMRLAMMLAAAAATPRLGGASGKLARRGAKALGSTDLLGKLSPELTEITGLVKGNLADAGKAAAVTAVNSRIEALTDRIHDRAEAWREAVPDGAGEAGPDGAGEAGPAEEAPQRRARRGEEAGQDRAEADDDENGEPAQQPERGSRRRAPARRAGEPDGRAAGASARDGEPARTRGRPARSRADASDSAVVRRRGRRS